MTGCKNNRYELNQIILWAAKNVVELVTDESEADFCVINTCTVTHVADRKSRQLIRKTKNHNPRLKTIIFGCGARVQKEEFKRICEIDYLLPDLPTVLGFLGEQLTEARSRNSQITSDHSRRRDWLCRSPTNSTESFGSIPPSSDEMGDTTSTRSRALVQVQDGCDNFCAYCITVLARGRSKNRPEDEIIAEINDRVKEGYNEVVLTGINIGAYGCSKTTKPEESKLAELLQAILDKTDIQRIRLTSMGPEYFFHESGARNQEPAYKFNNQLFEILKNTRICRHIHLAVQSGSDEVLKKMRRNYTVKQMDRIISRLTKDIPGIAITADVIVGFPEETDADFKKTVDFVRLNKLAKTHVFPYSARKGTAAAEMEQIADKVKKKRAKKLQQIADKFRKEFIGSQIGKKASVLWEKESRLGLLEGLTDNYIRVRKKGYYFRRSVTYEVINKELIFY